MPETNAAVPVFQVTLITPLGRRQFPCGPEEYIWNAAARAGLSLPAICHQGRCLTCASRLLKGDVDNSAARSYFAEDRDQNFVLICTACPRSDALLETHQAEAMRAYRRARGLPAPYS